VGAPLLGQAQDAARAAEEGPGNGPDRAVDRIDRNAREDRGPRQPPRSRLPRDDTGCAQREGREYQHRQGGGGTNGWARGSHGARNSTGTLATASVISVPSMRLALT